MSMMFFISVIFLLTIGNHEIYAFEDIEKIPHLDLEMTGQEYKRLRLPVTGGRRAILIPDEIQQIISD
jgi:hypothetical protein